MMKKPFARLKGWQKRKLLWLFGIDWKLLFGTCYYWWLDLGVWIQLGHQAPEHGMAHVNLSKHHIDIHKEFVLQG